MFKSVLIAILLYCQVGFAQETSRAVQTPYTPQKVVFEFFYNEPSYIASALYWIRSLLNPLAEAPYDLTPEEHQIVVVAHGTEVVAFARKNYKKYEESVERMRYYWELGVQFKLCALAAKDFGYEETDFYEFVEVVPSAMAELAHWQLQGYALIVPKILDKQYSIEEIR